MTDPFFWTIYTALTVISMWFVVKLWYGLKTFQADFNQTLDEKPPTVSVCIPARNETHAMTQCLERVVSSDYPRMEVIVLDDSSSDNTSILIKSFAHAGVRFVQGSELPEGWLGKNHALAELLEEASGEYVLFMDVDTQIQPHTISRLVAYANKEKADVVSVMPQHSNAWRLSNIFASLRYFREIILNSRTDPAVSSSAWLVRTKTFKETYGGFEPIRTAVQPEEQIAKMAIKNSGYRFIVSDQALGLSHEKKWSSYIETDVRLLYPILGGSIPTSILAFLFLSILLSPLLYLLAGIFSGWTIIQTASLWQIFVFMGIYSVYLSRVWRRGWWLGAIFWPVLISQELCVLIMSIYKYATHSVTWKGRLVSVSAKSAANRSI